ncbi:hypothetical protein Lal_00040546 [Lupinus albus]|nr:hypothetical protein Lal_00040546 [Lupinus albus]
MSLRRANSAHTHHRRAPPSWLCQPPPQTHITAATLQNRTTFNRLLSNMFLSISRASQPIHHFSH